MIAALRNSSIGIREVLESSDPLIRCIKVVAVIESLPGLGKVKARRILGSMDIEGHRRIRDLDDREKQILIEQVTQ